MLDVGQGQNRPVLCQRWRVDIRGGICFFPCRIISRRRKQLFESTHHVSCISFIRVTFAPARKCTDTGRSINGSARKTSSLTLTLLNTLR